VKQLQSVIRTLLVAATVAACGTGLAADFPTKPVEIVVPYPAGGGTDVLARAFAEAARKHLPQGMLVTNKPGASGIVGWSDVLNSRPDGYKVAFLATDLMAQPNLGLTKITYEDFIPIAQINYDAAAVTVRADAPWNTFEDFVASAKQKTLAVGNGGNGSTWHLAAASVEEKAGVKFTHVPFAGAAPAIHVPFAGAAPAILSLLGGHVDAITVSAAEVSTHVAGGKLKVLAVMGEQRIKGFEKVPTLKERGVDVVMGTFRGLAVAKGTPQDVVDTLRAATAKTAREQSLLDALDKQNMGYQYAEGDAFRQLMARDHATFKTLIGKLGIKP
jgi:tripartite-type tricarboxylate transporter receptor subunit TctC